MASTRAREPGERGGGGVGEAGLPEFAADFDLAGGGERGDDGGDLAEHGGGAGEDLVVAGAESDPGQEKGDAAEAEAAGYGRGEVDAEFGDRGVDQGGEAEDEGADADGGEDAVACKLGFKDNHDDGGEEQGDGGVADGKQVEAEGSEEEEEGAERTGDDGAGDVELEIDQQAAEDHEEDGEVGAGEAGEEALAGGGRVGDDGGVGEVEGDGGAVEAMEVAAVELMEEGDFIGGDDIDEMEVEGFGCRCRTWSCGRRLQRR